MGREKALTPQEIYRARKQREEEEKVAFLPPGLLNHGNTCFMNSVLQGLIATRLLSDLVLFRPLPPPAKYASHNHSPITSHRSPLLTNGRRVAGKYEKEWVEGMGLGDTLVHLLTHAWDIQEQRSRESMSPRDLLGEMGGKHMQYLDFAQQDAHEFMIQLLDAIRMEELDIIKKRQPARERKTVKRSKPARAASKPIHPTHEALVDTSPAARPTADCHVPPSTDQHEPQVSATNEPEQQAEDRLVSFIDMLFCGKLTSVLICQRCKHVSQTYEDFTGLSLPIKPEEYSKDRKRDVLKNLAKRLIPTTGMQIMRSSSVPPSPRREKSLRETEPVVETEPRRRSLDQTVVDLAKGEDQSQQTESKPANINVEVTHSSDGDAGIQDGNEMPGQDPAGGAKDEKKERDTPKDQDGWAKLGRRFSVNVGFGRDRGKKSPETERKRASTSKELDDTKDPNLSPTLAPLDQVQPAVKPHSAPTSLRASQILSPRPRIPDAEPPPAPPPAPPIIAPPIIARFPSLQYPTFPRSNAKPVHPPKPSRQEMAYLQKLLADTVSSNPFSRFRPQVIGSGDLSPNLWLKLGQLPGIEECLRMFTAVEMLDGENSVGCRRCWKILNGYYDPQRRGSPDDAVEDSDVDTDDKINIKLEFVETPIEPPQDPHGSHTESITPDTPTIEHSTSSSSASYDTSDRASDSSIPTTLDPESPKHSQPPVVVNGKSIEPTSQPIGSQPAPTVESTKASCNTEDSYLTVEPRIRLRAPSRWPSLIHRKRKSVTDESDTDASIDASTSSDTSSSNSRTPPIGSGQEAAGPSIKSKTAGSSTSNVPRTKQVVMRPAYKRYLIASAPPVLVIQLKRFQQISKIPAISFAHGFKKLDDYVTFPEYLDLGPYLAPRKEDFGLRGKNKGKGKGTMAEPCKYRLYAVVVHAGHMLGGHYIAYVALPPSPPPPTPDITPTLNPPNAKHSSDESKLAPQRQWAYVSDVNVRLTTIEEVLKAKAYICMYERL